MINTVVLAGNVVSDPEARSTSTGKSIATIRLAINNPLNDKDTVYIDVDAWEKQAEFVTNYVKKGSAVAVTGRLKQDTWEKNGEKRSKILVVAERVSFIGSKRKDEAQGEEDAPQAARPAARPAANTNKFASAPAKPTYQKAKPAPRQQEESNDEEIPI